MDLTILGTVMLLLSAVVYFVAVVKYEGYQLAAWWRGDKDREVTVRLAVRRACQPAALAVMKYLDAKGWLAAQKTELWRKHGISLPLKDRISITEVQKLITSALRKSIVEAYREMLEELDDDEDDSRLGMEDGSDDRGGDREPAQGGGEAGLFPGDLPAGQGRTCTLRGASAPGCDAAGPSEP